MEDFFRQTETYKENSRARHSLNSTPLLIFKEATLVEEGYQINNNLTKEGLPRDTIMRICHTMAK